MKSLKLNPNVIKKSSKSISGFSGIDYALGLIGGLGGMLTESEVERENRTVGKYEENGTFVSTVFANDTGIFETAVEDKRYCGDLVIVQEYTNREEAKRGHEEWVHLLLSDPPPAIKSIQDGEIYLKNN